MSTSPHAIVVLGGSFDPVHNGHVAMVEHLITRFPFSQIRIIPANRNPHKNDAPPGADPHHRLAMLREAFRNQPQCLVDPREALRPGPSYTFDTVNELRDEHPGANISLVIGADNLRKLPDWHRFHELCPLVEWIVFQRPLNPVQEELQALATLEPSFTAPHLVELHEPASSTEIRSRIRDGLLYEHLLPPPVLSYIVTHHLYSSHRNQPPPK